ncbi:MAG: hypothetical protein J5I59_05770 [Saprospiraceae bacterium]|nr:hypothetical protein [Saprospiraceae bacterium]
MKKLVFVLVMIMSTYMFGTAQNHVTSTKQAPKTEKKEMKSEKKTEVKPTKKATKVKAEKKPKAAKTMNKK